MARWRYKIEVERDGRTPAEIARDLAARIQALPNQPNDEWQRVVDELREAADDGGTRAVDLALALMWDWADTHEVWVYIKPGKVKREGK